jgi:hypothetical protein
MTALPGAAQGVHSPAGCRVVTLRRFQTLTVAMDRDAEPAFPCHIGWVSFVNAMTERGQRM